MNFILQKENGEYPYEFIYHTKKAILYNEWLGRDISFIDISLEELGTIKNLDNEKYIPVGSVEFVHKHIKNIKRNTPKPINIPNILYKYANRNINIGFKKDFINKGNIFIKSHDNVKGISTTSNLISYFDIPDNELFQYSDIIQIESEYRCFVLNNELKGIHFYSGDYEVFPDISEIKKMISSYVDAPIAYTLDVGVFIDKTFIIEVHNFYSCGLYGFQDYGTYVNMLNRWWLNFIKNK